MSRALVALGSNQGPREAILRGALAALGRLPETRLVAASRIRETPPESPRDGGPFLNAVALVRTGLGPRALVAALLDLERRWGRRRTAGAAHGGPRRLDLDLVLHEAGRFDAPEATVPHPRFRERDFVLGPAAEVAPDMRDPVTGRTVAELAAARRSRPPGPGSR